MIRKISQALVGFYRDEQGAEGLEKLLIIAAVVLPLLGLLIYFRGAVSTWVNAKWGDIGTADSANGITNPVAP